jgi:hypothetical protein
MCLKLCAPHRHGHACCSSLSITSTTGHCYHGQHGDPPSFESTTNKDSQAIPRFCLFCFNIAVRHLFTATVREAFSQYAAYSRQQVRPSFVSALIKLTKSIQPVSRTSSACTTPARRTTSTRHASQELAYINFARFLTRHFTRLARS